jgi:hypothetical protein
MPTKNFEGQHNPNDHRTVGSHRAWCHNDHEWCYPHSWCDCCHYAEGHQRIWLDSEGNQVPDAD